MYSELFSRYLAVTDEDSNPWLVAQSIKHPDRIYHYGGYSYMCIDSRINILKEYIIRDEYGYLDGDACEVQFHKDYPPIPGKFTGTGWLSPDGKFYQCTYAEHDHLATRLNAVLYNTLKHSAPNLENAGWIRFSRGRGSTYALKDIPTQQQINVVNDYITAGHTNSEVLEHVKDTLEAMLWIIEKNE